MAGQQGPRLWAPCPGSQGSPHLLDCKAEGPQTLHTMDPFLTPSTPVLSLVGVGVTLRVGEQLSRY